MDKMKVITTDHAREQYWKEEEKDIVQVVDCMQVVNIYPQITRGKVDGFGGAFTEASAYNYSRLSKEKQKEVIEGYFGEKGLRYNMGRIHINSCDFGLGNYTYVEEGDDALSTFSIEHDKELIIPFIKDAMNAGRSEIAFLASPWSPPPFMKTNGEMNNGGSLKKEYYQAWAEYFAKYIKAYEAEGIKIGSVTVQNEPEATQTWDSCIYTAEEEREFVRNHLGPVFEREGLSHIRIFIWDHNKEALYDRVSVTLADEKTREYVSGIAVHWYTGDHFEAISLVKEEYPDKEVYFTEGCVEYSRFADSDEVQKAEMYAHDILGNLNAGISGSLDWNLLLDELGGPNHVGNFCAAPMMCNTREDTLEKRLPYYYIGHFSRYIKAGAKKMASTKYTDRLEVTAFLNPDGERVIVMLNKTDTAVKVFLRENGEGNMFQIEPHSIITAVYGK